MTEQTIVRTLVPSRYTGPAHRSITSVEVDRKDVDSMTREVSHLAVDAMIVVAAAMASILVSGVLMEASVWVLMVLALVATER